MFRVGQKVVCVDDDPYSFGHKGRDWWPEEKPAKGTVYTVAAIGISPDTNNLSIQLVELKRRNRWGYDATRFRPVVERKTDISVFTEMIKTKKSKIKA